METDSNKYGIFVKRELIVFKGIRAGKKDSQIAADLGADRKVVKYYIRRICDKTGFRNRREIYSQLIWTFDKV